jgi:hypothetical protein
MRWAGSVKRKGWGSPPQAVTVLTCVVLFSHTSVFMMLSLDSVMESERQFRSDNDTEVARLWH